MTRKEEFIRAYKALCEEHGLYLDFFAEHGPCPAQIGTKVWDAWGLAYYQPRSDASDVVGKGYFDGP